MARQPKFDYDSREFYQAIFQLAWEGCTDKEIAKLLSEELGITLTSSTFSKMKNGKYHRWDPIQNHIRGENIRTALREGRRHLIPIIRQAYIKIALGGQIITSETRIYTQCTLPDGTAAKPTEIERIKVEREQPPNVRALDRLLCLLDPQWRRASQLKEEEGKGQGIKIEKWIKEL